MPAFVRHKWVRRLLGAAALLVVAVAAVRVVTDYRVGSQLVALIARIEADDPDWRLDRLAAARNAALPPDDRNPFTVAVGAERKLPTAFNAQCSPLLKAVNSKPATLLR